MCRGRQREQCMCIFRKNVALVSCLLAYIRTYWCIHNAQIQNTRSRTRTQTCTRTDSRRTQRACSWTCKHIFAKYGNLYITRCPRNAAQMMYPSRLANSVKRSEKWLPEHVLFVVCFIEFIISEDHI